MILNSPYISGSLTVTANGTVSGSLTVLGGITGAITGSATSASYAVSASEASKLQGLGSSSFAPAATFNTVSQSYAASSASLSTRVTTNETNISTLTSASSSFATMSGSLSTRVTNLEATSSTVSQSFASTSGSISGRVTLIEGQYATTGSNTFTGPQFISEASNAIGFASTASLYTNGGLRVSKDSFVSGTAYFNNVVVYGTSSIQYITSSQVNFGTNIITVNTDTPAVRFGGLSVFDSGSTQLTGSILWDSQNNHWIYSNPSGSSYNSAMLMNGPRNTGSLGTEQGTTNNALMKGQGGDHITSSQVIDDGTTVRIPGALQVTGSLINTGATTFGSTVTAGGTITLNNASANYATLNLNGAAGYGAELKFGEATGGYLAAIRHNYNVGTGLEFYTGGTGAGSLRMYIAPAGNIGIKTTSPSYLLDVSGSGRFTSDFTVFSPTTGATSGDLLVDTSTKYVYVGRLSGVSGDNTTFQVRDRTGTARATIPGGGSIDTVFSLNSSNFIISNYSSTALMTIANSGAATFSSTVTSGGIVSSEDVRIYRSAGTTTGYINFGSTGTNYFGWNGSNFVFNGSINATYAALESNVVGDPVYLRVRNTNTGGYPSSLALSLYGYATAAAYYDQFRIQASYPGYGLTNFIVKYQPNSADVTAMQIRGDGIISTTTATSGVNNFIMETTATNPFGPWFKFTTDSNNSSNYYWVASAIVGGTEYVKGIFMSNGGLKNYQSNNTNLSDIRTKKDILPLESYWDKFKAIEIVKFKYRDQTHDDFNIGVIAQQVEEVAPEFVDVDGWGREDSESENPLWSVYTADLHHATIKVLQEAMTKIEEQQAQIEALKARIETLEK